MTPATEEPPPAESPTPILDRKLRNLPPEQLDIIFKDKELTRD